MMELKGSDRKKLRGLAHGLDPLIRIGKQGLTGTVIQEIGQALEFHELIKVRFLEFKDRKEDLVAEIGRQCECCAVGMTGHTAIFYRQNPDPEKRKVRW